MHLPTSLLSSLIYLLGNGISVSSQGTWPYQTYKTSTVEPPSMNITKSGSTSSGYLFFDQNGNDAHEYNVFIMSDDNELVWQSDTPADLTDFRVQELDGKPVLTFYNGVTLSEPWGFGYGIVQILDDSYESIYNVSIFGNEMGYQTLPEINNTDLVSWIDMHETKITPEGTMLVAAINVTQFDLTSVGGPADGWVADSLFHEIDIKTNEILFRWSALEHVDEIPISSVLATYPLADLGRNQSYPYGYFHINSVEKFADGSYLIDSRHLCSMYHIALNGSVEWTLHGKSGGNFTLDEELSFCYQHDARIHQETDKTVQISIFNNDNAALPLSYNQSTGIFMTLDIENWTAILDQQFFDPEDTITSRSQGNLQVLEDDHVLMGYGSVPRIKEYDENATVVMTAIFGPTDKSVYSYRVYRQSWVGKPKTAPSALACIDSTINGTMVYMSWLGATEHTSWKIFSGVDSVNMTLVIEVERKGLFETSASVEGKGDYFQVQAGGVNITGGVSEVFSVSGTC